MKKILFISDSHGANYGATSYSSFLSNKYEIEKMIFAGKHTGYIKENIIFDKKYDYIFIQVGNPDVHPRMPHLLLKRMRKLLPFVRDSLFTVPPRFSIMYIIRFPFFFLRILVTKFVYREFYLKNDIVVNNIKKIYDLCKDKSNKILIFPLFKVSPIFYSKYHNSNVEVCNEKMRDLFSNNMLENEVLNYKYYKNYYNRDLFHFKEKYHIQLSELIINIVDQGE